MISKKFYTNSKKKINKGIVNHMIANIFNKEQNDDIKKNLVGVFPSNFVNRFVTFILL